MLWIPITLFAALVQTVRFAVQRKLRLSTLTSAGATYARFLYAGPLIVAVTLGYLFATGQHAPERPPAFWTYVTLGGVAQILATVCLVALFSRRNFSVGITLSKTEVLITAIIGFIILGDTVTLAAAIAMALGVGGVIFLSKGAALTLNWQAIRSEGAGLGVLSGLLFGFCSVMFRGGTQQIASADPFLRATQTLMWAILIQTAVLTIYLVLRDRAQIRAVLAAWRVAIWVGVLSLAGSIGWFTAFALQNTAYVKALGQVEVLFGLVISVFIIGEKTTWAERVGMILLTASVVGLILSVA